MTPPTAMLTPAEVPDDLTDDDFLLDLRLIESDTPLVVVMCATDDGCGSTCKPNACATSSNDPS